MLSFPTKFKLQVAGELVEYARSGDGPATVVLVNGSGGPIEGWYKVFEPVSHFATVLAYNRPGIGGSAKPSVPQVAGHMVESLRNLLAAVGLRPPYVLVGHSLGGLIVNLFARVYPSEVGAVVFLEASSPDDLVLLKQHESVLQRFLGAAIGKVVPPHPNAETEHVAESAVQLQAAPPFPAIPLTVISGGKIPMAWATPKRVMELRAQHQKDLALLSPLGRHVTAARSGHFPQFKEPQLVVSEIQAIVEKVAIFL